MAKKEINATPIKDFAIVSQAEMMAEIKANIGAMFPNGIDPQRDLEKITVPSGGGIAFTLETEEGEVPTPHIDAVIVGAGNVGRRYFATSLEDGKGPPTCQSINGQTGNPGVTNASGGIHVECATCPMAQMGSDAKGAGSACKEWQPLFLLLEDQFLPKVFQLPRTCLSAYKAYCLQLLGRGLNPATVVTRIGLKKEKNAGGIEYAVATFTMTGKVEKDDDVTRQALLSANESFAPALGYVSIATAQKMAAQLAGPQAQAALDAPPADEEEPPTHTEAPEFEPATAENSAEPLPV